MKNDEHPGRDDKAAREQEELVRPGTVVSEANDDGEWLEDRDEDEDEDDRAGTL